MNSLRSALNFVTTLTSPALIVITSPGSRDQFQGSKAVSRCFTSPSLVKMSVPFVPPGAVSRHVHSCASSTLSKASPLGDGGAGLGSGFGF